MDISHVDVDDITGQVASMQYPALLITQPNATTSTVLPVLEKGVMPVIVQFEGQERILTRVRNSAYVIDKLLRTHSGLQYLKDSSTTIQIESIKDYMEGVL